MESLSPHRVLAADEERPDTGKITVTVINHYGDEVLKVLAV